MKNTEDTLLVRLREYREAHTTEKAHLLEIPVVRAELLRHLQHYDQTGRTRRINRQKLSHVIELLNAPDCPIDKLVSLLDELRFPLEFWTQLRHIAERLPAPGTVRWRSSQQTACTHRNEILERTAQWVPKVRRINFNIEAQRIDDADGNGFLGLLKAIDNFNESEGHSFENYARIYILNQIVCYLRNDKLVKPSDTLRRFYIRHDAIVEELRQCHHREPTPQEIAAALEIDVEELVSRRDRRTAPVSMDSETGDEEEFTLHDILGQEAALPYERMENHLIVDRLNRAMHGLNPAESAIVNLRWNPFPESHLEGPIHPAPVAYEKMQLRSLERLACELKNERH